jgi:trimethylamine--corrinoid protein Co-methyltransferase
MIHSPARPPNPAFYSRLTPDQVSQMHAASLEILDGIGVRLDLPEAVELLRKAGARVSETGLVLIPPSLVENALNTAPRRVTLYNRYGEPVMPVEGRRCFFGPGSDCLNIIDHRDGQRRRPRLQDVVEGVRLCDALTNIDFIMSMILPTDVDQTIADTYQAQVMLSNSTKPLIMVSYGLSGLVDAVEMAEAVVGGQAALSEKPLLACYINVVSGALHNAEGLRKLLYLADKGLPAIYVPGSNAGLTSPSSMAGAVALDLAGGLAGLTLTQLRREGTPFILSAMDPAALDMLTMVSPYAYAERGIIRSVTQSYGLPTFALSSATDSKLVDQQAAAEAGLCLMADVLMGGNIVHDLGYLESGLTFSFAQLAICDQMVDWVKAFFSDIEVSDETLALEVIRETGPQGSYLKSRHTRRHFREHWYPDLFERGTFSNWMQSGGLSLGERAAQRVQQILDEHQPKPLPEEVKGRLREIGSRTEAAKDRY